MISSYQFFTNFLPDTSEEELKKSILTQYVTDVQVLLGRSQTYFGNLSQQATHVGSNLKQKLLD